MISHGLLLRYRLGRSYTVRSDAPNTTPCAFPVFFASTTIKNHAISRHSTSSSKPRYRQIILPQSWRGTYHKRKVFESWRKAHLEKGGPDGKKIVAQRKPSDGPLLLEIDTDTSSDKIFVFLMGIRFYYDDDFG